MTAKKPAPNKRPSNYITQASSLKLEKESAQYCGYCLYPEYGPMRLESWRYPTNNTWALLNKDV
ncbi:hypothetical protein GB937_009018 [Aspergillus fischeri]|nr:hypothetical protein GB937_009018 [Aspergillus fischeri]